MQSGSGLTGDLFFSFSFGPEDNNDSSVEMYNILRNQHLGMCMCSFLHSFSRPRVLYLLFNYY